MVVFLLCAMAAPTWAQAPRVEEPRPSGERPPQSESAPPIAELSPLPQLSLPSVWAYPLELLGLLGSPPEPGPTTLVPSIALFEEYTDNVFLDNEHRQWDLITGFSPTLMLFVERPSYRLTAGYSFAGELYARESRFNNPVDRQNFVATGSYQASPGVTLSAFDSFELSRNTNLTASQGFATGRQESWTNTVGAGLTWQITRPVSLNAAATYGVLRFPSSETTGTPGTDSDTYRLQTTLSDSLTRRLTATAGYGFAYFDFLGEDDNAMTHMPTVGGSYQLTPTLTAFLTGGPAVTDVGGQTFISPNVIARLVQAWRIGSASVQYARTVDVAGGFGGPTETETFSATLVLPAWQRGMLLVVSPAYSIAKSLGDRQSSTAGTIDLNAFTLPVLVTYRLNRYTSIFAGYTFFRQRAGASSSGQPDVDENRFRFGVQFGYPFRLP